MTASGSPAASPGPPTSAVLARLVVDALVAAGVTHVVVCPGSRSAPLVYALQERQSRDGVPVLLARHDERVAGFVALGIGRGGGVGAVVTTSGTAGAHLHPAVLEAHHAGVPLVVVTADRPPALRGTWANQTSELQASLYGPAVRAALDLPDGDLDQPGARSAAFRRLVETISAATGSGDGDGDGVGRNGTAPSRAGPVHLDLGFSEPLLPDGDDAVVPIVANPLSVGETGARSGGTGSRGTGSRGTASPMVLPGGPDTLVVAGDGAGPAARDLAEQAGWPLLAEPSSRARGGGHAVPVYRLLLELPELADRVERVVAFGRPTLSRPVTRLLARAGIQVVLVSPDPAWPDPGRQVTRAVAVAPDAVGDPSWLARWQAAGAAAAAALDQVLDGDPRAGSAGSGEPTGLPGLSGPLVARELTAALTPDDLLMAAASNPVRDLDLAARIGRNSLACQSNRGLSGIDGTVSTGLGLALGSGRRVRVLVGDVAFLHDAGALLVPPGEAAPPTQVVVLNDGGGGIFSVLEQGERAARSDRDRALFERFFATAHQVDVGALCAAYHVPHRRVTSRAALTEALATPAAALEVVEVAALARAGLRPLHTRIRSAVHAAVRATF